MGLPAASPAAAITGSASLAAAGLPAATTASPLALDLRTVSAASLTPDSVYTVTGTLRNGGSAPITSITVRLRLDWARLDAAGIAAWAAQPDAAWAGTVWQTTTVPGALAPGEAVDVSLSADSDYLGLPQGPDAFGPRGMAVEVTGDTPDGAARLAVRRSFVVWDPGDDEPAPVRLAVIAPITPPARTLTDDGGEAGPQLVAEWSEGGRLDRMLRAGTDPAIAWAIDPTLLTAAQAAGRAARDATTDPSTTATVSADPSPDPSPDRPLGTRTVGAQTGGSTGEPPDAAPGSTESTESPGSTGSPGSTVPVIPPDIVRETGRIADAWTTSLLAGAAGRDVYSLPWGDPDLAALAHARAAALLSAAQDAALAATRTTFGRPRLHVWPGRSASRPTPATLGRSDAPGTARRCSPRSSVPGTTPGRIALRGARSDVSALVTDSQLGAAVGAMAGGDGAQPLVGAQRALARWPRTAWRPPWPGLPLDSTSSAGRHLRTTRHRRRHGRHRGPGLVAPSLAAGTRPGPRRWPGRARPVAVGVVNSRGTTLRGPGPPSRPGTARITRDHLSRAGPCRGPRPRQCRRSRPPTALPHLSAGAARARPGARPRCGTLPCRWSVRPGAPPGSTVVGRTRRRPRSRAPLIGPGGGFLRRHLGGLRERGQPLTDSGPLPVTVTTRCPTRSTWCCAAPRPRGA